MFNINDIVLVNVEVPNLDIIKFYSENLKSNSKSIKPNFSILMKNQIYNSSFTLKSIRPTTFNSPILYAIYNSSLDWAKTPALTDVNRLTSKEYTPYNNFSRTGSRMERVYGAFQSSSPFTPFSPSTF